MVSFVASIFPKETDKSIGFYRDFLQLIFTELLWISGFFLLAWIFVVYVPLIKIAHKISTVFVSKSWVYALIIISISFVASLMVSHHTLERFANSSDEYAYLYQAETLGNGKLWEYAHKHPEFFYFNHIANKDGISVSRFPPGWPLILSTSYFFGFPPFIVNPILGLLTLIVFYFFAKRVYGEQVALWSLVALALSSFYIFNAASYFSHTSCALFTVGFVYCLYLYLDTRKVFYAVLGGFLIGMVAITRYYTAVIIFLPFLIYLIYHFRLKSFGSFFWMGVGGLPCILFLFWYNHAITGDWLVPVTMWAYADEALGFVRGHSILKGIEHIIRWTFMFMYWCSPAFLILYFLGLHRKIWDRTQRLVKPEDYFYLLLMIGYFFYYQIGGNQYGPRFFFEAFPFLVVFVVSKFFQYREKWSLALLCAGLIFAVFKFPFIAAREHRVIEERNDIFRIVNERKISNAVVFVASHTSVIRPMPKGDLTRNDVYYANDVIYAHDLGKKNEALMRYYPDRTFYKYVRDREKVEGKLIKVDKELKSK